MSVMTPMEFSHAEYSADHSTLVRRNIRNLRYLLQWLIRVESCERGKPCEGSVGLNMLGEW
jgi:hypothetical protein